MAIAYGIALQMDWDRPNWAAFAVAFISLPTAGQSLHKGALRMLGTLVQQQRDVLTTLVQMDPVYVVFNISRSHVFEIQLLKRQGKLFEVEDMVIDILLPDGSAYPIQGKVNFISYQINPATDTVLVRGIIANKKDQKTDDFYSGEMISFMTCNGPSIRIPP
jgi:multidrug efflux pump subunit AcrA (membrane-fusion protein)